MRHHTLIFRGLSILGLWVTLSATASAGEPRCYLDGKLVRTEGDKGGVTDMVRMRFDAAKKSKCETMLVAYCLEHVVGKDYSPSQLKAVFTPDRDGNEETRYTYTNKCKLVSDADN